jgi:4'-phosphopantetheinyl transferase
MQTSHQMRTERDTIHADENTLDLWFAYPDDLKAAGAREACEAILNAQELERAKRFRFEHHQREFVAMHALGRMALSHDACFSPEAWQFPTNEYGKPAAEPECGLRFNLSDSDELVICLVAREREVGVDVEVREQAEGILSVARRSFSGLECEQLEALEGEAKMERALALWTLKEAYIKARGMGMALPLREISFVFDGAAGIELVVSGPEVDEAPERWTFCRLLHAGHYIAMVVERNAEDVTDPELRIWQARPVTGPPQRLELGLPEWFPRCCEA